MAGHSKWANIQHRKGRQDAARSKLFSKLSREVTVAAMLGDIDPDKNPRLRLAIKEAKSNSVPKDVIDRAISKAAGPDADSLEEIRYEAYGPAGVAIIVEAMTDNRNRTASTIRTVVGKGGGKLAESGSVSYLFERKGEILFPLDMVSAGDLLDAAIDAGAEDIETSDECHVVYTEDAELAAVSSALEESIGEAQSAKIVWRPTTTTKLDLEGARKVIRLIEDLENEDDVQSVTANLEFSDEVLEAI